MMKTIKWDLEALEGGTHMGGSWNANVSTTCFWVCDVCAFCLAQWVIGCSPGQRGPAFCV